jgi:hypothetical protein
MKVLWNGSGAHEEFFNMVEPATMDHPEVTHMARVLGLGILHKASIKPHEKDGRSNPGDPHGNVEPTPQKL